MGQIISNIEPKITKSNGGFHRIPQELLDEANQRISLADLIGQTVALSQVSKDQWKGLCPFHVEKTPSFFVNETKGFFHCFGCGESGSGISFLMKIHGMSFRQAAIRVLQLAGLDFNNTTEWFQSEAAMRVKSVDKTVNDKLADDSSGLGDIYKTMAFWSDFCRDVVKDNPILFDKMEEIYLKIDDNYRFKNYERVLAIYSELNNTIRGLLNDTSE